MTKKRKVMVKDKKIKDLLKKERKNFKKDFFELLKRAATPLKN